MRKFIDGFKKNGKAEKDIATYNKDKMFTLEETRIIVNKLVNSGLIGEETVEEHMSNDDLLKEVLLRPGFSSVTWQRAEK